MFGVHDDRIVWGRLALEDVAGGQGVDQAVQHMVCGIEEGRPGLWSGSPMPAVVGTQPRSLCEEQGCFGGAYDLGGCCRCASAAAGWLQGVRRPFAACRLGLSCSS